MRFRGEGEGSGEFSKDLIQLKDGDCVKGVLRGDVFEFYQHWVGGAPTPCPGRATCPICKSGENGVFRFRLNFIVKEGDGFVAKIIENGWRLHQHLKSLHEGGFDLEKHVVTIKRRGSDKKNTMYTAEISPNSAVRPEVEAVISQIPLHSLTILPTANHQNATNSNHQSPHPPTPLLGKIPSTISLLQAFAEDDIPF